MDAQSRDLLLTKMEDLLRKAAKENEELASNHAEVKMTG